MGAAANLRPLKQGGDLRPASCPIIGDLRLSSDTTDLMSTVPLHLKLPADEVESLRAFAIAHGLTMAELVSRWAQNLKAANLSRLSVIHPDVIAITGLVPREWTDMEIEHQHHLLTKHSQTPGEGTGLTTHHPAHSAPL
jgi:hypothetical protein